VSPSRGTGNGTSGSLTRASYAASGGEFDPKRLTIAEEK
jgi:hypothetical protein